jgi:hypothetical protein
MSLPDPVKFLIGQAATKVSEGVLHIHNETTIRTAVGWAAQSSTNNLKVGYWTLHIAANDNCPGLWGVKSCGQHTIIYEKLQTIILMLKVLNGLPTETRLGVSGYGPGRTPFLI